jgi:choice-of-anchor A domain-containing protein
LLSYAIGGSAYGTQTQFGSITCGFLQSHGINSDTVVVGGSITWTDGMVVAGNIAYSGTATLRSVNIVSDCHARHDTIPTIDFGNANFYLKYLSSYLNTLPHPGAVASQYGNYYLTGTLNANLEVFMIPSNALNGIHSITLRNILSTATIIINVQGSSVTFANIGFLGQFVFANNVVNTKILWNFPSATSVTLTNVGIIGSVLAPFATFTHPTGSISGQAVVGNWVGDAFQPSSELHNNLFTGCI